MKAVVGLYNYLGSPATAGNQVAEAEATPAGSSGSWRINHRAWSLCAGSQTLDELRPIAKVLRGGAGVDGQVQRQRTARLRKAGAPGDSTDAGVARLRL